MDNFFKAHFPLERPRQEHHEIKVSMGYIGRPCFKETKQNKLKKAYFPLSHLYQKSKNVNQRHIAKIWSVVKFL
jgi:hypothetical protein